MARINGQLESRIGRPVKFSAPQDVHARGGQPDFGEIIDEVWADETLNRSPCHTQPCQDGNECWGDYSFCAQLIRWRDDRTSIRLAYYRRRCGQDWWEYASQMTVNSGWKTIKALLEVALAKTDWFQDNPPYSRGALA